ncbi:MAG: signal peptidase I [Candidatus Shapirobacteria bacterium]|nr:signal peptidase I [Candidatus Shapirobacteria bacterium]MDD4410807.1 signal peptidase I [Candidatus Shapirobacteria bacterium]
MLKKFKFIINIVEWIVFAFLLCFLFILFSPKLPIKNVPKSFIVVTGSMEPTIKTGSVAFVKNIDSKNIKTGDIIAFTSPSDPNDTILHRVNSISSTDPLTFKTKGDNNNDIDAWDVTDVGVKGIYITAIPYLGLIAAFIKKPLGFILIIGIPALIFIIFQLLNIKKAIAEEVDRKVSQKIAESKKSDSTKTILKSIIFFILFISASFSLSSIHLIKAVFSDTVSIDGINISIADFTKPTIPINLHWSNPDISCGGYTNSYTATPNWDDSLDDIAITKYEYEIIYPTKIGTTGIWHTFITSSQYTGVFNQGEGLHTFRVRAYDANGNISDWSDSCSVTYDKTIPSSLITRPMLNLEQDNDIYTIKPVIEFWDKEIHGTAFDQLSGVKNVDLSIYSYRENKFWNGTEWLNGTEQTVRVTAQGTTDWEYKINADSIPFGFYKIIAHAIDKAGNVENSATIEFEYVPTSVETITPTPIPTTDINLLSNHSDNKINLEITNISAPLDYEILYTGNGLKKGIVGHINNDEIIDSKYVKDFYFGTCSTGGNCTPETVAVGSIITVNLTGGTTFTKTFNY